MIKETIVTLSETAYKILDITYAYNEDDPEYTFCVSVVIRIPQFEEGILTATFSIDFIMKQAEKCNKSMARYVHTMIESYREEGFWERRAFEAFEEEGFDLEQLMRYSVDEMQVKFTPLSN
jgi:hypothetical protein